MSHFHGQSVFDRIRETRQSAANAVKYLGEDELVRSENDLVGEVLERFALNVPTLRRGEVEIVERGEVGPGQPRVVFAIPFDGQAGLFDVQPSSILMTQFPGSVRESELRIAVSGVGRTMEGVASELSRWLDAYETALAQLRQDLQGHNENLSSYVLDMLRPRRETALSARAAIDSLPFPVRRNPEASLPISVKKRTQVKPKSDQGGTAIPEWEIPLTDYNTILDSIRSMGHVMERSPGTFAHLSEEGIRDFFLVVLNFGFEPGAAMAEVFNGAGKTDILIRVKDRNVFIAECKVWNGADHFDKEAVQGLLGKYLGWRGTKCAILLFVYDRDVTAIFRKACDVIRGNDRFLGDAPGAVDELEKRFQLHWPGDKERPLLLTLQAFAVPSTATPRARRKAGA